MGKTKKKADPVFIGHKFYCPECNDNSNLKLKDYGVKEKGVIRFKYLCMKCNIEIAIDKNCREM